MGSSFSGSLYSGRATGINRWRSQVNLRRLEATLGSCGPADMFTVNRHLWARWSTEGGEVRFDCRYYKERLGRVEETGALILKTMKEFVEGLRLKGDPMPHVGFPAKEWEQRYWLAYVLGVTDDCPDT